MTLNPLTTYKGVSKRFFLLYKHIIGLAIGSIIAYNNFLPPCRQKGFCLIFVRISALLLQPFVNKEIRDKPLEAQLRLRLEKLGPTYIKLGQILAIREDILPKKITGELKQLLNHLPPVPFDDIQQIIEDSLGASVKELFLDINENPIGSASIGQTHLATTLQGLPVILKIIKPGIRDTILSDIRLLQILAGFLEWIIPQYQPGVIIDEFCFYTKKEVDLTYEADHLEIFSINFIDEPNVVFPRVYRALSSRDVLCMEFLDGIKPNDPEIFEYSKEVKKKIIDWGVEALIKMLFEDGFFHADLHAGNLIILPEPKAGFIDVGMVGRLEEKTRLNFLYYFYNLVNGDVEHSVKYLLTMSRIAGNSDPAGFKRDVSDLFRRYLIQAPHGNFSLARLILKSLTIGGKYYIFFPVEIILMVKALITFEGVGKQLDPGLDIPKISRKHINRIYMRRYNPQYIIKHFTSCMPELVDFIAHLPEFILDSPPSNEQLPANNKARGNNLTGLRSGIMAGACVLGGIIAYVQGTTPAFGIGLLVFGVLLFLFGK